MNDKAELAVGAVILAAFLWAFYLVMVLSNWFEAKADLAKQQARKLQLENDRLELENRRLQTEFTAERDRNRPTAV